MTEQERQAILDDIALGKQSSISQLRTAILNQNITIEQLILHLLIPNKRTAIEILLRIQHGNALIDEFLEMDGFNF